MFKKIVIFIFVLLLPLGIVVRAERLIPNSTVVEVAQLGSYGNISNWAKPELEKAENYGLIPNLLKGKDMTQPITREEFAEAAIKLYEKTTGLTIYVNVDNPFTDTKNLGVLKAYQMGITTGTSATTFNPNKPINREQVASMLSRTIRIMVPTADFSTYGAPTFKDEQHISIWALEHVKYMSKIGIIKGSDGNFMPKAITDVQVASGYANTTREQAISMNVRALEKYKINEPNSWIKYTSAGGNLSFHYPNGWEVNTNESSISIDNSETREQLIMTTIPYDKDRNPTDLAKDFVILLNENNSNMKASNWQVNPNTGNSLIAFDLDDKIDKKQYSGSGIVIKDNQQATWFSYMSPNPSYSRDRGLALLQGFIESISPGSSSKNPKVIYNNNLTAKIDANAKGFMFVLEFALGAPLTVNQECIILDELKSTWRLYTENELLEYDKYPLLVKNILAMNQTELDELRIELEKSIVEWLYESPDSDESVKIINEQLKIRSKEVIAGNPPLTEMSLTAYSEIIAYSRLLKQDPKAIPQQISQDSTNAIKKQVTNSWNDFTVEERNQVATTPGLWICLRTLINNGTTKEKDEVRSNLAKLTPETSTIIENETTTIKDNETSSNKGKPMNMVTHNVLMNMNNMTFNSYMWSRGFNYSPAYGKTW